jgi:hypothetical protein
MSQVDDKYPNKEINEKELIAKLQAEHAQKQVKETKFPTEIVDLPSKGLLYPEGHPLASGQIEMKYMTAREEDILASPNLIKKGIVIDKLLQSLIVTPVNYNDLLVGDKNAVMIASRILGYGKEYPIKISCEHCAEENKVAIDLTTIEDKPIDVENYKNGNHFEFTLPTSGRVIEFKFLSHGDEQNIKSELNGKGATKKQGVNKELTTRLKHSIISVDGNANRLDINNFVDNELLARDSKAFREYVKELQPDIDLTFSFTCNHCEEDNEDKELPIGIDFFWPDAGV